MPPTPTGRIHEPLLPSKYLSSLLKKLHAQDPTFKTAIFTPVFSEERRIFLYGKASINGIVVRPSSTVGITGITAEQRQSYLHVAAESGDVPLVCELIRMGASIDMQNSNKETPLFLACHLLARLSSQKNPINTTSRTIDAALAYRTRLIIRILVEQHADVNVVNVDGESPFVLLANAERAIGALSRLLLRYGADPAATMDPPEYVTRAWFAHTTKPIPLHLRPLQSCPCFSEKLLKDCHDGPELLSYPSDRICPCCDSAKIFGKCCQSRKIEFIETWDSTNKRLVRWKNPRGQVQKANFDGVPPERRDKMKKMLETSQQSIAEGKVDPDDFMTALFWGKQMISNALLRQGKMDRAFAYAITRVDFDPQPWGRMLSRMESRIRQNEFNTHVDAYIASATKDARPRLEIEKAAKIGLNGGPLYRRCEAEGCQKTEGDGLKKVLTCTRCKMAVYCSDSCQKKDWKAVHKAICGTPNQKEQQLPSQKAQMEYVKSTLGYQERVDISDAELRDKLRNHPEMFREIPYKG